VGSQGDSATDTFSVNRPAVSTAVIAKSAGGVAGTIKQGGTYYVYATVTGSGTPPAGLGTLTADVSAITTGQTATALSSGSYTVGGQTYNYRSAQLTAKSTLSAGTDAFTVKVTDTAGTATATSYSVTVDNTAPRASDVQTTNVTGGTAGKPEAGDSMTLTYSKATDPNTVLSGWSGASQAVVVAIVDGGTSGDDTLEVLNASTLAVLPFGTIDLGRKDYVSKTTAFGDTGTASTMVQNAATITVTLGTPSSTAGTAAGTGTVTWAPSSTVTDAAGNATSTASVNESGTSDKDF
jgi:chitinase